MRKVGRKLGWGELIEIDGLRFPEPLQAYLDIMTAGGLLVQRDEAFKSSIPLEQAGRTAPTEIVNRLVRGQPQQIDWQEYEPGGREQHTFRRHVPLSRFSLLTALRCLPNRTAWFRFADLDRTLFERIGEFHSVVGVKAPPYVFRKSAEEERAALDTWRREIRRNWELFDVAWMQASFRTWLYAFGMVDLHLVDGQVESFRLTDLGRALLWEESLPKQEQSAEGQTAAWIVQPNFEMVVYPANASTEQIAFLEQYAERLQVSQHTAQYRLTRESVYKVWKTGATRTGCLPAWRPDHGWSCPVMYRLRFGTGPRCGNASRCGDAPPCSNSQTQQSAPTPFNRASKGCRSGSVSCCSRRTLLCRK